MKLIDEQIATLQALDTALTRRPDFDAFWKETLETAESLPLNPQEKIQAHPFTTCRVTDLTYEGIDGTPINAWFILPPHADKPVPCVVSFHGSTGSRCSPMVYAQWLLSGCAVFAMDYRMQGGTTGSLTGFSGGPKLEEMVYGIRSKYEYYFRFALTDAYRGISYVRSRKEVDPERIAVQGASLGGGTTLIMAALHPSVRLAMADVPSFCDMERRLFERSGGLKTIAELLVVQPGLVDTVCETLSYFDALNHADRIRCPVLLAVGLKDPICTPESVYSAINKIKSEKTVINYPFGEHSAGQHNHAEKKLAFLRKHFFGDTSEYGY